MKKKKFYKTLAGAVSLSLVMSTAAAFATDVPEGFVPVREAFGGSDLKVTWDQKTKTVSIGDQRQLQLKVGDTSFTLDGLSYESPYAPLLSGGKAYVDQNFLTEYLNAEKKNDKITLSKDTLSYFSKDLKSTKNIYQTPVSGEKEFLDAINPETGWNFAKELTKIGSSDVGFRLGGTAAGKEAADLVYDKFKAMGLTPEYNEFKTYGWTYRDSSFKIDGKDIEVPVVSAVGTKPTLDNGIKGELVYVGTASKQDLENVDLTGKIALIGVDLDYQPWYSQPAIAAELHHAAGVIYYCENYYGSYADDTSLTAQNWGGGEVDIPVLCTTKKKGEELKALAAKEKLNATLISKAEINENAPGYNVIGSIKGAKYPDEFVIVTAHTDAHFRSFQDDSIAVGAVVTFAEAMKRSGYQPDRTIIFLTVDAEEFGAMGVGTDWLIGSWELMEGEGQKWMGKVVASMNLELMAFEGTEKFSMCGSDSIYQFVEAVVPQVKLNHFNGIGELKNEVASIADQFTFAAHGMPTTRTYTDPTSRKTYYHSPYDSPEVTDIGKYEDCLRVYGTLLARFDKMPVSPYNLTLAVDKYDEEVDYDALKAVVPGDTLKQTTKQYQNAATELSMKNALILKLYDKAKQDGKNTAAADKLIADYNSDIRKTIETILTGSIRLDDETPTLALPFYLAQPALLDTAIAQLEADKGEEALETLYGLPGTDYVDCNEYEVWKMTHIDNLDPSTPNRETYWGEDIKLQYFDHYAVFESLNKKIDAHGKDFTGEIKKLKEFKQIALKNIEKTNAGDIKMFQEARTQLPMEKADQVITTLLNI